LFTCFRFLIILKIHGLCFALSFKVFIAISAKLSAAELHSFYILSVFAHEYLPKTNWHKHCLIAVEIIIKFKEKYIIQWEKLLE